MIERKFVAQKMKEFQIQEYITSHLIRVGHSKTKLMRTPIGEKIIIYSSRPGLIVGKSGSNIAKLTKELKENFALENPQIELKDVENPNLDASIVAETIASALERYGTMRFKGIGHKAMMDVMNAGARGVEIIISGKVPSSRAKSWRFYQGYLKKCGDIALTGVDVAYSIAKLKSGIIGVKVSILPATTKLPDNIIFIEKKIEEVSETEPHKDLEDIKNEENKIIKAAKEKTRKSKEPKEAKERKESKKQKIKSNTTNSVGETMSQDVVVSDETNKNN
ncbi:MAG: 30S ribosomal protein S3 [Candidatus Woesearchaeota archaeon]